MSRSIIDGKHGLKIKLLETAKNGVFKLSAYVVDPVTLKNLSNSPKTTQFRHEEDRAIKTAGLINKTCDDWRRKHRNSNGGSTKNATDDLLKSKARAAFEKLDFKDPFFTQRWGAASTRKNASVFFLRNTLPFIEDRMDDGITRADVEALSEDWLKKAQENGHTKSTVAQLRGKTNQHLQEADLIYCGMRMMDPALPEIDFSPFTTDKKIQSEMAKSLPESVRQKFTRYLEAHIETDPKPVRGAVLMYDAALRTAEAAGVKKTDFRFFESFAIVQVRYQEKDGERCRLLKTDAAYRNVTMSMWGKTMVEKCHERIAEDDGDETCISADELRKWIKNALQECGLEEAFLQAARKLMDEEPDWENGKMSRDLVAYILRKDRTSRWLNICGLKSVDVDYLLGHELNLPKAKMPNFKTPEHHEDIAALLENYIYNPEISAHPYFSPVQMIPGDDKTVQPATAVSIVYRGATRGNLRLSFSAREVGQVVEVRVPKNCTPKFTTVPMPRREQRDQPVIGAQADLFIHKKEDCQYERN